MTTSDPEGAATTPRGRRASGSASPPRRRRAEVLETAGALFLEKGYEATSTTDIARALGILRGSIYYYMDTKEGLLFELLDNASAGFTHAIDELRRSDADALTTLRMLIEQHVLFLAESRIATTLFLTEARSLTPEHQAVVAGHEEAYRRAVATLIRQGQRDGVIRDDVDPGLATMLFLGAANWTHRWYGRQGRASAERVAREFATIIGDGLAPRPPGGDPAAPAA